MVKNRVGTLGSLDPSIPPKVAQPLLWMGGGGRGGLTCCRGMHTHTLGPFLAMHGWQGGMHHLLLVLVDSGIQIYFYCFVWRALPVIHLPVEMNGADGQSERDDGAVPPDDVAGTHGTGVGCVPFGPEASSRAAIVPQRASPSNIGSPSCEAQLGLVTVFDLPRPPWTPNMGSRKRCPPACMCVRVCWHLGPIRHCPQALGPQPHMAKHLL